MPGRGARVVVGGLAVAAAAALALASGAAAAEPRADLSVGLVGGGFTTTPGSPITLRPRVANNGPDRAQSVNVSVALTRGAATFVSLTPPSGWSCSKPAAGADVENVSCSTPQVLAGQDAELVLVVRSKPAFSGTIRVTGRVAASTSDPVFVNNASAIDVQVKPAADISVAMSGPAGAPAKTLLDYTTIVRNNGPGMASPVSVRISVPAQTTYVSTRSWPWSCTYPDSFPEVVCTGTLAAGETRAIELSVAVAAGATGTISSRASAVYSNDPNAGNNDATLTLPVTHPRADIAVTVNASSTFTAPGSILNYAIRLRNDGPDTAYSPRITVPVPAQTTGGLQSLSAWGCAVDLNSAWFCSVPELAPGAWAEFYLSVRVDAGATGTIMFSATGASQSDDPVPGNNTVTATATIADVADVGVTMSGPAKAAPDAEIAYVFTVTNQGPATAHDVSVYHEDYPGGFVSITEPAGWQCNGPSPGGTSPVGCNAADLAAGASATFTLVVRVDADATDEITNEVTVASLLDPNGANDSASVRTPITDVASDLSVAKTGPASAPVGADVTYQIAAGNHGPDAAANVSLTDRLPSDTTFVSLDSPAGWSCSTPSPGAGGDVVCSIGELPVGGRASFTVVARVAATAAGTITNTASITSDSAELGLADNSSSAVSTVPEPPASPTSVVYNGEQTVNLGFPLAPGALASSTAPACTVGRAVTFTLDVNPFSGTQEPFLVGIATTGADGQATPTAVPTGGWLEGVYTITAVVAPVRGCAGASDSAAVTVAAPGTAANGAGWYSLPGSGRVSFGFTARLIAGTGAQYSGSVRLLNEGKWRLRGRVSTYARTADGMAAVSGIGELSWWNPALNGGLGDWEAAAPGVTYTINFTASGANRKLEPGTFGIRIVYGPVPPQPSILPNSAPQALRGGAIALS